ncbi:MAG: GNAT family N-acetyltransferase [Geminicoccales bacterium]
MRCLPATEEDKLFLKDLNREVYESVVVEQFGAWDDAFQDRHFEEKWAVQEYQIVEQAGQRIGAIWVAKEPDHLWLREIQISPSHQNQGIGTELLMKVMDEAGKSGLPLRLRVLTENRAKALYERLGFKVIGMHGDTHYWMEHAR